MNLFKMMGIVVLSLSPFLFAHSQNSSLPFSFIVKERTENLPPYVSPPEENLYNSTPGFKVGWGIDYPIGFVHIQEEIWTFFNVGNQYGAIVKVGRFKGTDFEHAQRQPDGAIEVQEKGISTHFLGGLWYDDKTGKLYAPIHCEYDRGISPPAGWTRKKTRLATSTDKGLTWHLEGDILTAFLPDQGDWLKYSGSYFEAGPADFDLYVDRRGGYFYIFTCNAFAPKNGRMNNFLWFNEVARCAIKDKMAPGKWWKFCNGSWTQPGLGGKSSRVSMGSTGIYGRIIFSTYLKKYIRIGTSMGVIDKRYTDLGFTDGSIYISACDNLSRQEWTPMAKLSDRPENNTLGFTLADFDAKDPFECGRGLHVYNYWLYNLPSRALDVTFDTGKTPTAGFPLFGSYAYEPLPESGDSVVSRRTRIVSCADSESHYTGDGWRVRIDPSYYRTQAMECANPGSSVKYTFRGSEIYWRAAAGNDCGKADVFVDGKREAVVDNFFRDAIPYQFAFIKRGLDPGKQHTIVVVVRQDSNVQSAGRAIRHIAFESSAEYYKASAGFSSINGKNNWRFDALDGQTRTDLRFVDFIRTQEKDPGTGKDKEQKAFANWWVDSLQSRIGNDFQIPGKLKAMRTWVAPHSGHVRISGDVHLGNDTCGTARASIVAGRMVTWESGLIGLRKTLQHNLAVNVKKGDLIDFVVEAAPESNGPKVLWDPVVTYVGSERIHTP
jgi:hypothetical protein